MVHPTIVIRRDALIKSGLQYDKTVLYAQDYVLYSRLWKYGCFANLQQSLLRYRVHDHQGRITSNLNNAEILKSRMIAWRNLLKELDVNVSDEVLNLHDKCCYYTDRITKSEVSLFGLYLRFMEEILVQNNIKNVFDRKTFNQFIHMFAYRILRHRQLKSGMFWVLWVNSVRILGLSFWLKVPFKRLKDRYVKVYYNLSN